MDGRPPYQTNLKWCVARCCEGASLYRGVEVRVPPPPPDTYAPSVRKVARLRKHPQTYGERGSRLASAETTTGAGLIPESPFQSIAREGFGRAVAPSDESGGAFSCRLRQPEAEIRPDNPEQVKLSEHREKRPKIGLESPEKFFEIPRHMSPIVCYTITKQGGKGPPRAEGN